MQVTIGTKLTLGIGTALALFSISGLAIHSAAAQIADLIAVMSRSDEPATVAAHEMEVNLGETGLALKDYLHDPSPEVLERLSDAEEDFREAHAQYRDVVQTDEARKLGERVGQAYGRYVTLTGELIGGRDRQTSQLRTYFDLQRWLHGLIEQRVTALLDEPGTGSSEKLKAVMGMETNAHQLGLDLISLLVSAEPQDATRFAEDAREFARSLDRYEALALSAEEERWGAELRRAFDDITAQIAQLSAQEERRQDRWADSIGTRLALDDLLDNELQRHIQGNLDATKQDLLEVGERGASQASVLLLAAVVASTAVGAATARSIARPLRHLLSAVESMRRGDLPPQVTVASRDEVADLARAFNCMADDLRRTTVSRAYVEGVLRGMSEALIVITDAGGIETVNPAACVLLGYRETELAGLPFARVLPEWPALAGRVGENFVRDREAECRTRDGRRIPILLSADRVELAGRGATVCVALDVTERKRARQELAQSRERLRELARHLNTTIETDRTRIAREVHDQLGQAMTSLKLDLRGIGRRLEQLTGGLEPEIGDRLGAMSRLVDDTIRVVRRVAAELRPAALDDLGLGPALELLAEQFQERTGIACAVERDARPVPLTPAQATALYRIAQEALTNVSRHAGARHIRVRLRPGEGAIALEIGDDGRGITAEELAGRRALGLLGMQERAAELGGAVSIDGSPGAGTVVRAVIPIVTPGAAPGTDEAAADPNAERSPPPS